MSCWLRKPARDICLLPQADPFSTSAAVLERKNGGDLLPPFYNLFTALATAPLFGEGFNARITAATCLLRVRQSGRCGCQQVPERGPKGQNLVVWGQMTTYRAVTMIWIAIEFNVLDQEMAECAQQHVVPIRGCQYGVKNLLKATIFIAGQTGSADE